MDGLPVGRELGTTCRTEEAQETSGQKRRERADSSIFIYILFILVLRNLKCLEDIPTNAT